MLINVSFKNFSQSFSEGSGSQVSSIKIPVDIVTSEVLLFFVQGYTDFDFIVDVLL